MSQLITLPLAERFVSIQGEGRWTGTPMAFIRLAGCSVGKGRYPFKCTAWSGTQFTCDTDYRLNAQISIEELVVWVQSIGLRHVSITGGEPLIHEHIAGLIHRLCMVEKVPHVETSGTILFPAAPEATWWTVSPKKDYLQQCLVESNEIKVLVDSQTSPSDLGHKFGQFAHKLYLQPINQYAELDMVNVKAAVDLLMRRTNLAKMGARLSLQVHKPLEVR